MLVAGVLTGLGAIWLVVDHADYGPDPVLGLFVGWSFIASGLFAALRRPENDLGPLMVVIGMVWLSAALLKSWEASVPVPIGVWLGDVWWLPLAFLLVGFPTLRVEGRPARAIIAVIVLVLVPLELLWLMCLDFADFGDPGVPHNALLVWDSPKAAEAVDSVQRVLIVGAMASLYALLLRRWWRARGPLRRVMHPVLAGAVALALFVPFYASDGNAPTLLFHLALVALAAVPLVFLA